MTPPSQETVYLPRMPIEKLLDVPHQRRHTAHLGNLSFHPHPTPEFYRAPSDYIYELKVKIVQYVGETGVIRTGEYPNQEKCMRRCMEIASRHFPLTNPPAPA
ncbi:hypothetical protein GCM10011491_29940 [Brucella endophytica]|uniref:Uncharacterized protein n=1 Tax=Brucella endophytica TaxID=1963359 RepID=A0A916WI54_9HYPH|nr:hypothetical protein GCM10011491_29940 [Brucella endophytica]